MKQKVRKGDIFYIDLGKYNGNLQGGERPCVILQNDIGNRNSTTTIVAPITTKVKKNIPTHAFILFNGYWNTVLLEQILTINIKDLKTKVGKLSYSAMFDIEKKLKVSFGLI